MAPSSLQELGILDSGQAWKRAGRDITLSYDQVADAQFFRTRDGRHFPVQGGMAHAANIAVKNKCPASDPNEKIPRYPIRGYLLPRLSAFGNPAAKDRT
jgi:hypothetical protein